MLGKVENANEMSMPQKSSSCKVMGVAASGDSAAIVVVACGDGVPQLVAAHTRKIDLANHEDANELVNFMSAMQSLVTSHGLHRVFVRRCTYGGMHQSGAAALKIEALVQLTKGVEVVLIPPQRVAKFEKRNKPTPPEDLMKYQWPAYFVALCGVSAGG